MTLLATCLATLLAIALLQPFSCAGQSVCTITDPESVPLCDGDVMQVYPNVTDERTALYFAFMQSFSGGYISSGGIAGVMVALDEINDGSRSSILPGYRLYYTLSDNAVRNGCRSDIIFYFIFILKTEYNNSSDGNG